MISTLAQGLGLAIRVLAMRIMARLLSPDDFGLMGIVGLMLTFADCFKDLGLSTVAIQSHELSHHQASCVLWLNPGITALIAVTVYLGAGAIAESYERPKLIGIGGWYALP